jgi:hypothetical protein
VNIPDFLDRRPLVGTYTLLNTFKNVCEHQAYRRYIKRDQPYVETEAMRWGTAVHKAMDARVGSGVVLPDDMRQWEHYAQPFDAYAVKTELQLGINRQGAPVDFWASDVWFRGKIDVAVIANDKALITDWKTGSSKFEDPLELACGALLLKAAFPQLTKTVGRYIYLKENKIGQMHDLSDFGKMWTTLCEFMSVIADKIRSDDWPKRKSGLCGWCSVKDCENHFVARP